MVNLRSLLSSKILLLVVLSCSLVSCEEKAEEPVPATTEKTVSAREILLAGENSKNWLITGWTYTQQGIVTDMYPTLDSCELDNIYVFSQNKSFKQLDNQLKCLPNPQLRESTWALQNNETELKHTFPGDDNYKVYRIIKLNHSNMVLNQVLKVLSPGDTVISTTTYIAN